MSPAAQERAPAAGRLIVQEGNIRVVRTGPHSMVMEERQLDALGEPAWVTKIPLSDFADGAEVEGLLARDLYALFSAWERS